MQLHQNPDVIVVGIGDCKTGHPPTKALSTYALGSCVAVVAWDWKLKLGGLLHVMLPDSSIDRSKAALNPHLFVDTGVPALLGALIEKGSAKRRLRWCIAGGAEMMADSAHFEIGKRNHLALKKVLRRMGIFVDQEDVGGSDSRSIWLNLCTGQIDLRKGMGRDKILVHPSMSLTSAEQRDSLLPL